MEAKRKLQEAKSEGKEEGKRQRIGGSRDEGRGSCEDTLLLRGCLNKQKQTHKTNKQTNKKVS